LLDAPDMRTTVTPMQRRARSMQPAGARCPMRARRRPTRARSAAARDLRLDRRRALRGRSGRHEPRALIFTDFITPSGDSHVVNNLFFHSSAPSYADIQVHDHNQYTDSGGTLGEANGTSGTVTPS
jgi:hypothetical protein